MKIHQLLALSRPLFEVLVAMDVNLKDVHFLDMYTEYETLVLEGEKKTYIEAVLCDKYKLKRAKFYNVIKSFQQEVVI